MKFLYREKGLGTWKEISVGEYVAARLSEAGQDGTELMVTVAALIEKLCTRSALDEWDVVSIMGTANKDKYGIEASDNEGTVQNIDAKLLKELEDEED